MEIGNRKERVRDYASFPDESPSGRFGRQPNVTPYSPNREAHKSKNQERSVPDSTKAALNRREAKMGFGDEIPKRGLGRQSQRNPVLPKIAKHIKARVRERSVPDSTKAALNRREAKMGFGDEIPKRGLGRQSQRNPPSPKKNVVSEQNARHSAIETGHTQNHAFIPPTLIHTKKTAPPSKESSLLYLCSM